MLGQILVAAAALCYAEEPAAATPFSTLELHPIEQKIVELTNHERRKRGLSPLELDAKLLESARRHTAWMTNSRSLRHTRKAVGENIAMGQRSSREVVRDWMRSSGHRANILNRSYRKIGAAAYVTPNGTIYWCQQFLR